MFIYSDPLVELAIKISPYNLQIDPQMFTIMLLDLLIGSVLTLRGSLTYETPSIVAPQILDFVMNHNTSHS